MTAAQREALIAAACAIRQRAHAPYSRFFVGAAVMSEDGTIFSGINVENASFGLTVCAERVAVFTAVAAGHRLFRCLAVASEGRHAPCGACRQVLMEFQRDLPILLVDPRQPDQIEEATLAQLLPSAFTFPHQGQG
jgi:cytidine deaminase